MENKGCFGQEEIRHTNVNEPTKQKWKCGILKTLTKLKEQFK